MIDAYICTPYSHPDPAVRCQRFTEVNRFAVRLVAAGLVIYSPITHSHPLALAGELPLDWAFWQRYDREFIAMSRMVIVLKQDGWEKSVGVRAELALARRLNMPIFYWRPAWREEELEKLIKAIKGA